MAEITQKLNGLIYYRNFVFRDTDIEKIKKLVHRNQIKFIGQVRWSSVWNNILELIFVLIKIYVFIWNGNEDLCRFDAYVHEPRF